ncbi:universal stress protein [Streptomyces sp. EN27]|uniref:universal stress protein n=1 Tax=Streptomyces sp. EN27 TaxID=211464 RepID=UPI000A48FC55
MTRSITVGLDGSPESRAAADWAAREAALRKQPVRMLHVWHPVPDAMAEAPPLGTRTHQHWTERIPRDAAQELKLRHPGVQMATEQRTGVPAEVLLDAAHDSELLVLGSRALSGLTGFLVGSVGQSVVARAEVPVVLVRAGRRAADEHVQVPDGLPSTATGFRPVVLGLDTDSPDLSAHTSEPSPTRSCTMPSRRSPSSLTTDVRTRLPPRRPPASRPRLSGIVVRHEFVPHAVLHHAAAPVVAAAPHP